MSVFKSMEEYINFMGDTAQPGTLRWYYSNDDVDDYATFSTAFTANSTFDITFNIIRLNGGEFRGLGNASSTINRIYVLEDSTDLVFQMGAGQTLTFADSVPLEGVYEIRVWRSSGVIHLSVNGEECPDTLSNTSVLYCPVAFGRHNTYYGNCTVFNMSTYRAENPQNSYYRIDEGPGSTGAIDAEGNVDLIYNNFDDENWFQTGETLFNLAPPVQLTNVGEAWDAGIASDAQYLTTVDGMDYLFSTAYKDIEETFSEDWGDLAIQVDHGMVPSETGYGGSIKLQRAPSEDIEVTMGGIRYDGGFGDYILGKAWKCVSHQDMLDAGFQYGDTVRLRIVPASNLAPYSISQGFGPLYKGARGVPTICLTFDDSGNGVYRNLQYLTNKGIVGTLFIRLNNIDNGPLYFTVAELLEMKAAGWDIQANATVEDVPITNAVVDAFALVADCNVDVNGDPASVTPADGDLYEFNDSGTLTINAAGDTVEVTASDQAYWVESTSSWNYVGFRNLGYVSKIIDNLEVCRQWLISNGLNDNPEFFAYPEGVFRGATGVTFLSGISGTVGDSGFTHSSANLVIGSVLTHRQFPVGTRITGRTGTGPYFYQTDNAAIDDKYDPYLYSGSLYQYGRVWDDSAEFATQKFQTAARAAGWKLGRTTRESGMHTRYGVSEYPMVFPAMAALYANTDTNADLDTKMAKWVDSAVDCGKTQMVYFHNIYDGADGINTDTDAFKYWVNKLAKGRDRGEYRITTVKFMFDRDLR